MRKYRIIQFKNGDFGIQRKNGVFSFWEVMPFEPFIAAVTARNAIKALQKTDLERAEKKKGLKISKVYKNI